MCQEQSRTIDNAVGAQPSDLVAKCVNGRVQLKLERCAASKCNQRTCRAVSGFHQRHSKETPYTASKHDTQ